MFGFVTNGIRLPTIVKRVKNLLVLSEFTSVQYNPDTFCIAWGMLEINEHSKQFHNVTVSKYNLSYKQ